MTLENVTNEAARRRPVRRKKSKLQIFKEVYLPTVIIGITIVLVLVFLIGGAIRRNQKPEETLPSTDPTSETDSPENLAAQQAQEAQRLLLQAQAAADDYNFEEAMTILSSFSGNMADFPELLSAYNSYSETVDNLVVWDDPSEIVNLSFHVLIADETRAYADRQYSTSYKNNFITVSQLRQILDQLYSNGYVLVDLFDVYTERYDESTGKTVYEAKALSLPAGKTPFLLTQTHVNYYTYMVDGDGDGMADAQGAGFAHRLEVGVDGKLTNVIINADGTESTGEYDLVPILESFIEAHPDFSYHGARAILGITGYDGVFGYRINSSSLSASKLEAEQQGAAELIYALQQTGYRIACYTYDNINYGDKSALQIQSDLEKWAEFVQPWITGGTDILIYARDADIGDTEPYSGAKFNVMYNAGFRFFMGVSPSGWSQVGDMYVRHNRVMITGSTLRDHPDRFTGMFDAATLN